MAWRKVEAAGKYSICRSVSIKELSRGSQGKGAASHPGTRVYGTPGRGCIVSTGQQEWPMKSTDLNDIHIKAMWRPLGELKISR